MDPASCGKVWCCGGGGGDEVVHAGREAFVKHSDDVDDGRGSRTCKLDLLWP